MEVYEREGLEEWVSIYELLTRTLVKEHSLYSHDPNCFPKDSWLIQFMEGRMCYTWEKVYHLQSLCFLFDYC